MPDVINLAGWREEHSPHMTGQARCVACGHEHVCVAPVGTVWMECPACRTMKVLFVNFVERPGRHWYCRCGNAYLHVTPAGVYCPNCGEWQCGF